MPVGINDRNKGIPRSLLYAVMILIVPGLIVGFVLLNRIKSRSLAPSVSSIMVLPLENLSGDSSQEYFADGVTDALIGDLAKLPGLQVISRTSSMHYKGTKKALPEIAREIKVDAIVEGSVQRSGDRVVVRAQLIHAATDKHLWVETYERPVRDVLDLQSEIAQKIAFQVKLRMTDADSARLAARHPVSPKAFDDYLQGRYLYWNKRTEENLNIAIRHFQNAIAEDPRLRSGARRPRRLLQRVRCRAGQRLASIRSAGDSRRKVRRKHSRSIRLSPTPTPHSLTSNITTGTGAPPRRTSNARSI
jgi:TolB-like protein